MRGKYFNLELKPDLVHGDISKLIASDKTDAPFTSGDILFDWHVIQVPKGSFSLESITVYMVGEDGGAQASKDIYFVFAKSLNGVAPSTLGEENAVQTSCFELPLHLIGAAKVEATTAGNLVGPAFGGIYHSSAAGSQGVPLPLVMTPEPYEGSNVGYNKVYVAAFAGGTFDFSTGVLSTGDIVSGAGAGIAVDTVDARKSFQKGDYVYVHDVDTICGIVSRVSAGTITLEGNNGVAISNNDEIMNATPIKCIFGISQ